jgi:anti-anti-sigma factor
MSLEVERRSYGSIAIIRCTGAINVGDSLGKLEEALRRALTETGRIVLDLSGVDRLDSTGMGLLVRFLSHIRKQGGDLRLCSPSQFVRKLLAATKLDSVFLVCTSDYNAIASFFVRAAPGEERRGEFAATVLFFDQSDDLCAFARSVLGQHGYEVLTTNSLSDAHLLAQAAQPSVILVGHRAALENRTVETALQAAAPNAAMVTLPANFAQSYANQGAAALLNAVKLRRLGGVSEAGADSRNPERSRGI